MGVTEMVEWVRSELAQESNAELYLQVWFIVYGRIGIWLFGKENVASLRK